MPLTAGDFSDRTVIFADLEKTTIITFNGDGTGTVNDDGTLLYMVWSVGAPLRNVLRIRGTGEPGTVLLYHELFLTRGTPFEGEFVALLGATTDVDGDGEADTSDFEAAGRFEGIGEVSSSLMGGRMR